jgi:alcohol-forming fatty acyl-CoA reductase
MNPSQAIAAFFDIDGTLLPYPSLEWRFVRYLLLRKAMSASNAAKWLVRAAHLFLRGPRTGMEANKLYLAGVSRSLALDWANEIASNPFHPDSRLKIFGEGKDRIGWHQSQNHRVFLVSGTLAPLANMVAELLPGTVEALATEMATESPNGERNSAIWTGELAAAHMVGEAKRDCVLALATRHDLNLSLSYAYGDSVADCAMLECVGHPEAINPSWGLRRAAHERGWPISRWSLVAAAQQKQPESFDFASATPPRLTTTGKSR